MKLKRIRRLIKLLGTLQTGRGYNTEHLARDCGVCRRTIFRDLEIMREAGVPLVYNEREQRCHIPGTYFLPPTNFTPEEALALIVLCHDLGGRERLPFFAAARNAAIKLESSLPTRMRERLLETVDAVQIQMSPTNPLAEQQAVYDQLIEAISQRRSVRINYGTPGEEGEICTRLSPYRLLFSRRSWYVIGRSSLHRSPRTFNVGRITRLVMLEDKFEIPRGFSIERYLRNAWRLIPEPGPDQEVVIRFDKKVAKNVAEVNWHKTQRVEFNDDGSLDFRVTVSGVQEISWWVLGYGDRAEVLQPAELRRIVASHAAGMCRRYGKGGAKRN